MKVLLTSAGLETDTMKEQFLRMIGKDSNEIRALFVPTAAVDAGAIQVFGFRDVLLEYINKNGVVIGVSAGSIIFGNTLPDNLDIINTRISVHCDKGEKAGKLTIPVKPDIRLTNSQAIVIYSRMDIRIIE